MKLYNSKQTLELEKKIEAKGIDSFLLMLRAGKQIIELCKKYKFKKIIVLAGSGNNGGDALAATLFGLIENLDISCIDYTKKNKSTSKLKELLQSLNFKPIKKLPEINNINENFLIIDGLLGIGINRRPEGNFLKCIRWTNRAKKKGAVIISIDIPSGLNPNSGTIHVHSVKATATMMCLTPKLGCYTGDGLLNSGDLLFNNLGIKINKYSVKSESYLLEPNNNIFIKRNNFGYKGLFGNVLIVGGWNGMAGAANLTATAAFKTGAGKIFIHNNNPERKINEIIHLDLRKENLKDLLKKMQVIIAGPGLGKNAYPLLNYIWDTSLPLILDADALKWLAYNFRGKRKGLLISTPHYGEAKILLKKNFSDRLNAINQLKKVYGGNWILKGPGTIILEKKLFVNNFSNSILSTAGTGDILSGILGGLVSQKVKEPAKTAVHLHSKCAIEILKKGKKTILASEIINEISSLIN